MIAAVVAASVLAVPLAAAEAGAGGPKTPDCIDPLVVEKIRATLVAKGISGVSSVTPSGQRYQVAAVVNTQPAWVWVDPESGVIKLGRY
jgi:hypothetical protein